MTGPPRWMRCAPDKDVLSARVCYQKMRQSQLFSLSLCVLRLLSLSGPHSWVSDGETPAQSPEHEQ